MKTNLIPGIFIPYFAADFISEAESETKNLLGKTKNVLQSYLSDGDLFYACQLGSEGKMILGLFFKPYHPHQMGYKSALDEICRLTGNLSLCDTVYTVPLHNVSSAGTGTVSKSVWASGNFSVVQVAEILKRFRAQCGLAASLTLVWSDNGCELHGTSPLGVVSNHSLAWQNHMSKAFKAVLPHITAIFYQTWSTNAELTRSLTGKGREISAEREAEYERYSRKSKKA